MFKVFEVDDIKYSLYHKHSFKTVYPILLQNRPAVESERGSRNPRGLKGNMFKVVEVDDIKYSLYYKYSFEIVYPNLLQKGQRFKMKGEAQTNVD